MRPWPSLLNSICPALRSMDYLDWRQQAAASSRLDHATSLPHFQSSLAPTISQLVRCATAPSQNDRQTLPSSTPSPPVPVVALASGCLNATAIRTAWKACAEELVGRYRCLTRRHRGAFSGNVQYWGYRTRQVPRYRCQANALSMLTEMK